MRAQSEIGLQTAFDEIQRELSTLETAGTELWEWFLFSNVERDVVDCIRQRAMHQYEDDAPKRPDIASKVVKEILVGGLGVDLQV
mmetsp:Transcript_65233/g.136645  ORF Transcript_65233/g.136645 Transcript_65233/m.136645 type:complete len:85 (-) Transcript_65233:79-333(-)